MKPDRASLPIFLSNALALAVAAWEQWPLVMLLWPYWCQSVIIGWFARKRILALGRYSTAGFTVNGRNVAATPDTQRRVAWFFALHYGLFHLIYALFLCVFTVITLAAQFAPEAVPELPFGGRLQWHDPLLVAGLAVSFWFSHRKSHREHVAADLARTPNLGTLMFMPYLRVLPMHMTILLGMALGHTASLLLFGVLKTAADVGMHLLEHRWLQRGAQGAPATPTPP